MESYIILSLIFILSIIAKNKSLMWAIFIVFCFKLLFNLIPSMNKYWGVLKDKSIYIGIIIISVYILVPVANGSIGFKEMFNTFSTKLGLIALLTGIIASILSTKGIMLQSENPEVTVSLMLGTIIGVVFLGGTATGPIVAGGIAYLLYTIINKLF